MIMTVTPISDILTIYLNFIFKYCFLSSVVPIAQAQFVSLPGTGKNKHWAFSTKLNKLYVDINRWVQVSLLEPRR
jgi:hypothetical protein